jgi:aspartate/glutamate racemase
MSTEPGLSSEPVRHIGYLADAGAEAVLVTCSSIGEAVEAAAHDAGIPVLRVDAPMAAEAIQLAQDAGRFPARAGRIIVLATLAATLGPTGRNLERYAAGTGVEVDVRVVEDAFTARRDGNQAEHDRLVRDAVADAARQADVIVLAQASMAGAIDGIRTPVPVLTSPKGGVASLVQILGQGPHRS